MKYLIYGIKGMAIGIANAIPGVSGGTIALIVGIYKKMMDSIGNFFRKIKNKETRKDTILFLGAILVGAAVGVYLFAKLMTAISKAGYTQPLYFFFAGLIAGSIPYIIKINKDMKINIKRAGVFVLGFGLVISLILLSIGRQNANSAGDQIIIGYEETGHYETITITPSGETNAEFVTNGSEHETYQVWIEDDMIPIYEEVKPEQSTGYLIWLAICGFLAAGSMIVPGFSGSALLVALGEYENILYFVDQFSITPLIFVAAGAGVGIFLFAKLIAFFLKKYPSGTYYFILGLIFASFYQIWLKVNESGFSYDGLMLTFSFLGLAGGFVIAFLLGKFDLRKNAVTKQ